MDLFLSYLFISMAIYSFAKKNDSEYQCSSEYSRNWISTDTSIYSLSIATNLDSAQNGNSVKTMKATVKTSQSAKEIFYIPSIHI